MKIAIASQNRRSVTDHVGRCRRFWIYQLDGESAAEGELLELPKEGTLHALAPDIPPALQGVNVLIAAEINDKLRQRLHRHGIEGRVSACSEPADALAEFVKSDQTSQS
ncbi:MAG: NifB/NifX family molybdenum-iron cluster-binding protein [Halieaceae bacterium]|jgi:predicted Fe-Mo cluster-binding NifX family protein|nr:NifB/NifX family molybdenum-iron cluster-binding protein [Halieaceae bacterium]